MTGCRFWMWLALALSVAVNPGRDTQRRPGATTSSSEGLRAGSRLQGHNRRRSPGPTQPRSRLPTNLGWCRHSWGSARSRCDRFDRVLWASVESGLVETCLVTSSKTLVESCGSCGIEGRVGTAEADASPWSAQLLGFFVRRRATCRWALCRRNIDLRVAEARPSVAVDDRSRRSFAPRSAGYRL